MNGLSAYLNVTDIETSMAFYEGLGFEAGEAEKAENGHVQWLPLKLGDCMLGIGEIAANTDADFQAWVSGTLGGGVILNFRVDDVTAISERAEAIGAVIEEPLADWEGEKYLMLNDPDGYSLMFIGAQ